MDEKSYNKLATVESTLLKDVLFSKHLQAFTGDTTHLSTWYATANRYEDAHYGGPTLHADVLRTVILQKVACSHE